MGKYPSMENEKNEKSPQGFDHGFPLIKELTSRWTLCNTLTRIVQYQCETRVGIVMNL